MEYSNDNKNGYGKRPVWKWIVIYLIIAVVVYGGIYYAYKAVKNNNSTAQSGSIY